MVKNDSNWLGLNGSDTIPRYKHSGAEIMRRAIETMHATYIGYHGYAEEWLAENPRLTKELANICGYWYFPVSAGFKKVMKNGDNIISMKWINRGVAPAYENYNIVFRLENTFNNEVIESEIENAGNKGWIPDSIVEENYKLFLTDNTPSGKYILKFKLVKKSLTSQKMIDIGLRKDCFDKDGFVEIGTTRFH
jgi:hypothetical protein